MPAPGIVDCAGIRDLVLTVLATKDIQRKNLLEEVSPGSAGAQPRSPLQMIAESAANQADVTAVIVFTEIKCGNRIMRPGGIGSTSC